MPDQPAYLARPPGKCQARSSLRLRVYVSTVCVCVCVTLWIGVTSVAVFSAAFNVPRWLESELVRVPADNGTRQVRAQLQPVK